MRGRDHTIRDHTIRYRPGELLLAAHRRRRRLVRPALHHRQVGNYLEIMAGNADATIDAWRPGQRVDIYDLARLSYLNGVVHETLRLYPPAVVSARGVATGFEFAGREVRAGSILLYSPYVTHRLATFATTELTVMLARLLARTALHLPEQRIRPTSFAAMRPAHGLRVDVRRRTPTTR